MLSLVIPLWNERESLRELWKEIDALSQAQRIELEAIFVDDGSKDGSFDVIRELAAQDPRVRGIRFRRNFGKAAALSAGFRAARGQVVCTLDADLQDDPGEIPHLLAELDRSLDVVSGWKKVRHDPWHKTWPSKVFNFLVSRLTGVHLHDHNCGLKCYRAEVLGEIRLYGELHRFVPVLAHARGFRVGEAVIQHRPRQFGHSKYGVQRLVKGLLDLLSVRFVTRFGQRPQHVLGTFGLLFLLLGLGGLAYLGIYWCLTHLHPEWQWPPLHDRPALLYSLAALLLGGQMFSLGLLAELIVAQRIDPHDAYSVAEEVGRGADPAA